MVTINLMTISLESLNYPFTRKPLLIGGKAMEYYDLRKAGDDIDLVADEADVVNLVKMYPNRVKDLWGDIGVCPFNFEIWTSICLLGYDDFKDGATDIGEVLVISKEKLLLSKALIMDVPKYLKDAQLVGHSIKEDLYHHYDSSAKHNIELLKNIEGLHYIERKGPDLG